MSYLRYAFVQTVNLLDRRRVCEGQLVGSKPDNIAMLPMELEIRDIRPPLVHIVEPPPVCDFGRERTRVFVEAVIEMITEQVSNQSKYYSSGPVLSKGGKH